MTDKAKVAALILGHGDDGGGDGYDAQAHLEQAMEDFHRASHADSPNYKAMAAAFRSAFECLENEEHDEDSGEAE